MTVPHRLRTAVDEAKARVAALHAELPRWELIVWSAGNVSERIPGDDGHDDDTPRDQRYQRPLAPPSDVVLDADEHLHVAGPAERSEPVAAPRLQVVDLGVETDAGGDYVRVTGSFYLNIQLTGTTVARATNWVTYERDGAEASHYFDGGIGAEAVKELIDNLDLALQAAKGDKADLQTLVQGVEMVRAHGRRLY